jgi:hypothetical protein
MMNVSEFYNKLSDKERKIFYGAIIALVIAFFDMLFLRPVLSRLDQLDGDIRSTTQAVERNIRFISYRDKIFAEDEIFRQYETDEAKTGEEIIAGFLKTIEGLASETKVSLSRVTPSDVVAKKGFVLYFANVECAGKLEDVITFMHHIDSTNNLLKIVQMNMAGNKASKEEVKVEMKVAKLVIDPATVGNYEFDMEDIGMPQSLLDDAATEIGLSLTSKDGQMVPSGNKAQSGLQKGAMPSTGDLPGDGSGGTTQQGSVPAQGGAGTDGNSDGGGEGNGQPVVNAKPDAKNKMRSSNPQKEDVQPTDVPKKQERVQIESIEGLWQSFIGKYFGKGEDVQAPVDDQDGDSQDQEKEQRNLWERKMIKK